MSTQRTMRRASASILLPSSQKNGLSSNHDAPAPVRRATAMPIRPRRASFNSTGSGSTNGFGAPGAGAPEGIGGVNAKQALRTSKTTTKLVLLPSEPQTAPTPGELLAGDESSETLVTQKGRTDTKSAGERMTKAERNRAGYRRLTAYCVAEGLRMKLLSAFLKREHNVTPRVFDEALYAVSPFVRLNTCVRLVLMSMVCVDVSFATAAWI